MTTGEKLRVVIADDHPIVLGGLKALLSLRPDIDIIATVPDGASALEYIRSSNPHLAILDVNMPELTGVDILENIIAEGWATKVILLTASASDGQIQRAVHGGAYGVMLKDCAADTLLECIDTVASGERWLPADLIDPALERHIQQVQLSSSFASLTPRELELAMLVAEGFSNKEISRQIRISDGTVRIHLHNIYQKLGISSRTALAALVHRKLENGST